MTISAINYMGGKNYKGNIGPWICSNLPKNKRMYVEPFAGMLGVLLQRKKSPVEWANDLDKRIYTWWKVIRDSASELIGLLENTPYSKSEFDRAINEIEIEKNDVKQALNVTVILWQSYLHCLRSSKSNPWSATKHLNINPKEKIILIHKRIKGIILFNEDVSKILERTKNTEDACIYCDPPYLSTETGFEYGENKLDIDKIIDLSKKQKGFVAFSGYNDEWDALGWEKIELKTKSPMSSSRIDSDKTNERSEFIWINKRSENYQTELFG